MLRPVEPGGEEAVARGRRSQAASIEEVRARFEQWRQTRRGKARIPDELWSAAVTVAQREGCNRTAAALGLDGGKLRKQMVAADSVSKRAAAPAFLELIAPEANVAEYTIELEGRNGTLRIHCKGVTATQLAELSRSLWSSAS
jgi:tRNA threonylcarbamoyladenosine modification (KEOPS) complex  Pcc1 subunit